MASPASVSDFSDPTFQPSTSSPAQETATKPTKQRPNPHAESSTQAQLRANHRSTHRFTHSSPVPRLRPILKPTSKSPSKSRSRSPARSPPPGREQTKKSRKRSTNPRLDSSPQPSSSQNLAQQQQEQQQNLLFPGPFTSSPSRSPAPEIAPSSPSLPAQQLPKDNLSLPSLLTPSQSQSRIQSPSQPPNRYQLPTKLVPRPNRYHGPPSTWRSWTLEERTVAASVERMRATDLAAHLYCAYALKRQAEKHGTARGRGRGNSSSVSRSRSRSRSAKAKAKAKDKGKGKEKEKYGSGNPVETDEHEHEHEPATEEGRGEGDGNQEDPIITFDPPRLWTAWPLPPDEVPRDSFLPALALGAGSRGYRRMVDARPSAELEECLIAVAARAAKERWQAREWEDVDEDEEDDNDGDGRSPKKKRRIGDSQNGEQGKVKSEMSMDVQMEDGQDEDEVENSDEETTQESSSDNDGIQYFSSQVFAAPASPSEQSMSETDEERPRRPVFLADDDRIRQLLLPSTRHVISQFDNLLQALHKMQSNRRRKIVNIGGRGIEEVLGMAGIFFSQDVVNRAKERCTSLFDPSCQG